jgi:2-methylisocitrate lyase-like PEP mutase family enzyme
MLERVRICAEVGVDAIVPLGIRSLEELEALRSTTSLPVIMTPIAAPPEAMAARGARLAIATHLPYYIMLRALYETYTRLRAGASAADIQQHELPAELRVIALDETGYGDLSSRYLGRGTDANRGLEGPSQPATARS